MDQLFRPFPKIAYFDCVTTGYYPTPDDCSSAEAKLEGGPTDRLGRPLCTLQDYLDGKTGYVSCAMDTVVPYGALIVIPDLDRYFKKLIEFRCVDTGSAFRGKGKSRMDICTANKAQAELDIINAQHFVIALAGSSW